MKDIEEKEEDKIRNTIFKIESGIKNPLTALEDKSLQTFGPEINNG